MKLSKNRNPVVPGFKAVGLSCGIKDKNTKDLALIVSNVPATAAGVFTKNRIVSPGVTWSRNALSKSKFCRAIIVNSGNANTVVGPKGFEDCDAITKLVAEELSIPQKEVLIASTGVIGVPLPSHKILQATPKLVQSLGRSQKHWTDASEAIMTTDLVSKSDKVSF
ncbi:MAG TPA: bifunctional glutamate N-acetyltransferase/amino-acid acetyltransferase ArgJ, partial [Nitrospinaceae bacterium]|nr:bifunctional glutamate N-acetyltransferase/amino-acid acetyltransferase ArgJ [Nitrospinaceae bacterium]